MKSNEILQQGTSLNKRRCVLTAIIAQSNKLMGNDIRNSQKLNTFKQCHGCDDHRHEAVCGVSKIFPAMLIFSTTAWPPVWYCFYKSILQMSFVSNKRNYQQIMICLFIYLITYLALKKSACKIGVFSSFSSEELPYLKPKVIFLLGFLFTNQITGLKQALA